MNVSLLVPVQQLTDSIVELVVISVRGAIWLKGEFQ